MEYEITNKEIQFILMVVHPCLVRVSLNFLTLTE